MSGAAHSEVVMTIEPVTKADLADALSNYPTKTYLEENFPTKAYLEANYPTKAYLDEAFKALEARLLAEVGRMINAAIEIKFAELIALLDPYRDLPAAMTNTRARLDTHVADTRVRVRPRRAAPKRTRKRSR